MNAARPPKPAPRRLPLGAFEGSNVDVPGIGRFVLQSVGDANRTSGMWTYLHREGAEEAARFYIPFSIRIDGNLRMSWEVNRAHANLFDPAEAFSPEEIAAAREVVDGLDSRNPLKFMFQVTGAIDFEIRAHEKEVVDLRRLVDFLKEILSGSKKTTRTREDIEVDLRRREEQLAKRLDVPEDSRLGRLYAARAAISEWAKEYKSTKRNPRDVVDEALAGGPVAAPMSGVR